MKTEQFFVLSDKNSKGAFNAYINLEGMKTLSLFRGEIQATKPVNLSKINGNKLFDLISAGNGMYLLRNKVFETFEVNKITGWGYIPSIIHVGKGENILDYGLLTVKGRCGPMDFSKSEIFIKQPFTPTGTALKVKRGLYFDQNTWDGSDIFTPENTLFTFITEQVKLILIEKKFTNLSIECLEDFEIY